MSLRLIRPLKMRPTMGTYDIFNNPFFNRIKQATVNYEVDVLEDDEGYQIIVDLPGFSREEIKITLEGQTLTIRAESLQDEKSDENSDETSFKYLIQERGRTQFNRSLKFKKQIDTKSSSVEYSNGVLQITLKKSEESKPVKLSL